MNNEIIAAKLLKELNALKEAWGRVLDNVEASERAKTHQKAA